jgi:hypothetical protein
MTTWMFGGQSRDGSRGTVRDGSQPAIYPVDRFRRDRFCPDLRFQLARPGAGRDHGAEVSRGNSTVPRYRRRLATWLPGPHGLGLPG